jgi:RNA recognition motif-containing protein
MSKRLYVGNLAFTTSEQDLQTLFQPYGCTQASIPTDESGRSRGFGFVDVEDEHLQAAIDAMHGKDVGGRTLNVNEARPREERGGGGGGYRGGGGGGGYGGGGGGGYGGGGGGYGGGGDSGGSSGGGGGGGYGGGGGGGRDRGGRGGDRGGGGGGRW